MNGKSIHYYHSLRIKEIYIPHLRVFYLEDKVKIHFCDKTEKLATAKTKIQIAKK